MDNRILDPILLNALNEDIGSGDITTDSCVPEATTVFGRFIAKQSGIICGLSVAARVFTILDQNIILTFHKQDGDPCVIGDLIAEINGNACAILKGERTALNFLQHLSGIATMTQKFVAQVPETCKIVDTRKTTPGLRILEKYAVRMGSGHNHRFNLADGVLIKDNHIVAAGGIERAVCAARAQIPHTVKIEVETTNIYEVQQALDAQADIIMLDNMTTDEMRQAVKRINGRALTEASGNMDTKNLTEIAETGVDRISIGALTHSPPALDISLKLDINTCTAVI